MASGIAMPDLSRTFEPSPEEANITEGHVEKHVLPVGKTNKSGSVRVVPYLDLESSRDALCAMKKGQYVQFMPACVDGFNFSVKYFPKGHICELSASELFARPLSSIGLSLSNKLDVFHRLRRPVANTKKIDANEENKNEDKEMRKKPPKLKMFVSIESNKQTLTFNLNALATDNIVFKNLNFGTDSQFQRTRCLTIKLDLDYKSAWQLHVPDENDFRLKVYRFGLEFGDMEIFLIEGDVFKIYRCNDAPDSDDDEEDSDIGESNEAVDAPDPEEAESTGSSKKMEANDQELIKDQDPDPEKKRPPVLWEHSIKVALVNVMSRCPHFETWIKRWHFPKAIGMVAPSLLHLNWFAFYVATGQLHDSSDAVWFVTVANAMTDERLLKLAMELCIQRLTAKNIHSVCSLFYELKLAEGQAHLRSWIIDNQKMLSRVMVLDRGRRVDLYDACKKALCWVI